MPPDTVAWLGLGFLVTWVLIGAYLFTLARQQREIARKMDELQRRSGPPASLGP